LQQFIDEDGSHDGRFAFGNRENGEKGRLIGSRRLIAIIDKRAKIAKCFATDSEKLAKKPPQSVTVAAASPPQLRPLCRSDHSSVSAMIAPAEAALPPSRESNPEPPATHGRLINLP
jgi:hypothetical protein